MSTCYKHNRNPGIDRAGPVQQKFLCSRQISNIRPSVQNISFYHRSGWCIHPHVWKSAFPCRHVQASTFSLLRYHCTTRRTRSFGRVGISVPPPTLPTHVGRVGISSCNFFFLLLPPLRAWGSRERSPMDVKQQLMYAQTCFFFFFFFCISMSGKCKSYLINKRTLGEGLGPPAHDSCVQIGFSVEGTRLFIHPQRCVFLRRDLNLSPPCEDDENLNKIPLFCHDLHLTLVDANWKGSLVYRGHVLNVQYV